MVTELVNRIIGLEEEVAKLDYVRSYSKKKNGKDTFDIKLEVKLPAIFRKDYEMRELLVTNGANIESIESRLGLGRKRVYRGYIKQKSSYELKMISGWNRETIRLTASKINPVEESILIKVIRKYMELCRASNKE